MEDFSIFIETLKKQLKKPLPGKLAQLKMASEVRLNKLDWGYDTTSAKKSSVLILLYPFNNSIFTVLMKRAEYNGVHSSQISFPGGQKEKTDNNFIETALREANEEVGILPEKVEVIGQLSDMYIPPSNFLVYPIVGFLETEPQLTPDNIEVEQIIKANIKDLFDESKIKEKVLKVRGYEVETPYFDIEGHVVWGATAMMLSELKEIIKRMRNPLRK